MKNDKKRFKLVRFAFETKSGGVLYRYMITDYQIPMFEINQWIESRSLQNANTGKEYAKKLVVYLNYLHSMVSSRGKSKGCFATFVERKSRLYTALKMPDRTADSMEKAIYQLHGTLPAGAFKTGTTDRCKEFACYRSIEENLKLPLYFADPYSSWQRGSNENSNGLLREFYPKKTDLAQVDEKQLIHCLFLINSRPRKCLGWKSPIQVFLHEVAHLT